MVDLSTGQVLVYQPQINSWKDNQLDFRAALAYKADGSKDQAFGVVFATTRTQVDRAQRNVVFEDLKIGKLDFPDAARSRRRVRPRAHEGVRGEGAH